MSKHEEVGEHEKCKCCRTRHVHATARVSFLKRISRRAHKHSAHDPRSRTQSLAGRAGVLESVSLSPLHVIETRMTKPNEEHQHLQAVNEHATKKIMKETDGRVMSQAEVAELEALFANHERVKAFPVSHPLLDIPASTQAKVVYFVRHAEGKWR